MQVLSYVSLNQYGRWSRETAEFPVYSMARSFIKLIISKSFTEYLPLPIPSRIVTRIYIWKIILKNNMLFCLTEPRLLQTSKSAKGANYSQSRNFKRITND